MAGKLDNRVRIHIRMGNELHDWFENKAVELGVTTAALMVMAMSEYRKTQLAAEHMPMLAEMFKSMQLGEIPIPVPLELVKEEI